jgi:dsRNA-specific ribonuclease
MSDLAALQSRLGYLFRDESLLRLALTHHPSRTSKARPFSTTNDWNFSETRCSNWR